MKNFFFKICLSGMLMFSTVFAAEKISNPYVQMLSVLKGVRNNFNSFEAVEAELNKITPADCQVDKTSISAAEMEFLLNLLKLDFAVTLKKGKKALDYAKKLEALAVNNKFDYKKLSPLLLNLDIEYLLEFNICQAYIIMNYPEKVINRLQKMLSKHKEGSSEYAMVRFSLGFAFLKMEQSNLAIPALKYALDYFVQENNKPYAAIAATNLSVAYLQADNQERSNYYRSLSAKYAGQDSSMVECELALVKLLSLVGLADEQITQNVKDEFKKTVR